METVRNSDLLDSYYNSGRRWSEEVYIYKIGTISLD